MNAVCLILGLVPCVFVSSGDCAAVECRGDIGMHHGHLHGQDRHSDDEPDDGTDAADLLSPFFLFFLGPQ